MRMANGHLSVCIPSPGSAQHLCQFTKTKCWSVCEGMNLAINTPHLHTPGVYLYISTCRILDISIYILITISGIWMTRTAVYSIGFP